MPEIPEDELAGTRAALAPTLEATAAILPWLAKPKPLRFDRQFNERWIAASQRLATAWSDRHGDGADAIRPAIFALYGVALETLDSDCLQLGEALASAADLLENGEPAPRLVAALTATIECLNEASGLEHALFGERARHFAERLVTTISQLACAGMRSPVLDHLFAEDSRERLEQMHEALAVLPPDAYALKTEAAQLAQQAEQLELYGVMHLARQLANEIGSECNLDSDAARERITATLCQLATALAAVDP